MFMRQRGRKPVISLHNFWLPVLNYFDCVRVFEAVKEVDGDSKSLFGQYTSPRVKVGDIITCSIIN